MPQSTLTPNLLTFDIEGFIESSHESMRVPSRYLSERIETEEIEVNTMAILDLLGEFDQKATFFILGRIARDMPALVRRIAEAGHEIGCHSFHHRRLFHFPRPEVEDFLRSAKQYLEDASGRPVRGFRAPEFSITRTNLWTFDVLQELGFRYDSSVVPTGLHDVYGIGEFPAVPFRMSNGLVEVPLSTVKVLNQRVPLGGGGYLRLYPLSLTEYFFRRLNRRGIPGVVYLHPFEMGKALRRLEGIGLLRTFRTYNGVHGVKDKLRTLLRKFAFLPIIDYLEAHPVPTLGDERHATARF